MVAGVFTQSRPPADRSPTPNRSFDVAPMRSFPVTLVSRVSSRAPRENLGLEHGIRSLTRSFFLEIDPCDAVSNSVRFCLGKVGQDDHG